MVPARGRPKTCRSRSRQLQSGYDKRDGQKARTNLPHTHKKSIDPAYRLRFTSKVANAASIERPEYSVIPHIVCPAYRILTVCCILSFYAMNPLCPEGRAKCACRHANVAQTDFAVDKVGYTLCRSSRVDL